MTTSQALTLEGNIVQALALHNHNALFAEVTASLDKLMGTCANAYPYQSTEQRPQILVLYDHDQYEDLALAVDIMRLEYGGKEGLSFEEFGDGILINWVGL